MCLLGFIHGLLLYHFLYPYIGAKLISVPIPGLKTHLFDKKLILWSIGDPCAEYRFSFPNDKAIDDIIDLIKHEATKSGWIETPNACPRNAFVYRHYENGFHEFQYTHKKDNLAIRIEIDIKHRWVHIYRRKFSREVYNRVYGYSSSAQDNNTSPTLRDINKSDSTDAVMGEMLTQATE